MLRQWERRENLSTCNGARPGKKDPPLEIIVVLHNTHEAIMGERKLLDSGLEVRIMPMPKQFGPGCGMALRINPGDLEKARALLGETIQGLYCRAGEGFVPWNP